MDFSYSEEQQMLRNSISKFISERYDFESRQKIVASERGFSEDNWKLFAELGWLAVPFAEEFGGLGGAATDLMVVMEEFGKAIVVEPFLANLVLAGGLVEQLGSEAQVEQILTPLMSGQLQMAFAFSEPQSRYNLSDIKTQAVAAGDELIINGHKAVVLNAQAADKLIVSVRTEGQQRDKDGISLVIIDKHSEGVDCTDYTTVDGFRAAEVKFTDVKVRADQILGTPGGALKTIEMVVNRATLAVCAEAVGAMEVLYKKTVEYCQTRKQFGVAIAKFQALQHRMADMYIEYELAKSMLLMAAMQLDANQDSASNAISAAKNRIGKAARRVGQEAVQLHGGVGVTHELDVGHYFKRLTTIQFMFGSSDFHMQRYQN